MSYQIVGGCVAPSQLAPFLRTLQAETGCAYDSVYRGSDAAALLHRVGKHTQEEIYWEYIHGEEPNPANPPGRSTHELRSDGVAYPEPIHHSLPWWCCGIDVDDAHVLAVIVAGARHGWHLFRPYSGGSEYHHINFRAQPHAPSVDLRVGDSGSQIRILSVRLQILGLMKRKSSVFGAQVHGAVVRFQRLHHMKPDGIVGPKTWLAIKKASEARVRGHR